MPDSKKEELKYGEYKARIEIKDSIGTPYHTLTTWRADVIEEVLVGITTHGFKKGSTVIIEIIPANTDFKKGLFTEV